MKNSPLSQRRFIVKWATGWFATGRNMKRWNFHHLDHCPHCNIPDETKTHILLCPCSDARENWSKFFALYRNALDAIETNPYITRCIVSELTQWINTRLPRTSVACYHDSVQQAVCEQRSIGWDRFLEGKLSPLWCQLQSEYFHSDSKYGRSGSLWTSRLIREGWTLLRAVWDFRNEAINDREIKENLEGRPLVIEAIQFEWRIGLNRLPITFSYMFRKKLPLLLKHSLEYLKDWLLTLRLGRETHKDPRLRSDCFSLQGSRRRWLEQL